MWICVLHYNWKLLRESFPLLVTLSIHRLKNLKTITSKMSRFSRKLSKYPSFRLTWTG